MFRGIVHRLMVSGAGANFLSDVLSFGRQLNMTEIMWFPLLNPTAKDVLA